MNRSYSNSKMRVQHCISMFGKTVLLAMDFIFSQSLYAQTDC